MVSKKFHISEDGPKPCRATKRNCPYSDHYENQAEAQSAYEDSMRERIFSGSLQKSSPRGFRGVFSSDSYYGDCSPLDVQMDALNGVVNSLESEDQTQLIAACGTGKTYMGRQILNNMMEREGANGISVVLTSSIKLAQDTAADMRPEKDTGDYDHSFGKYGEDYEVIEVHSSARMVNGRQSVLDNGVISTNRIKEQMERAVESGKKVVIASTYDSSYKVREAQERFEDTEKVQADIILHDEAHNILGQQTPTSYSTEVENNAYTGFHNDIPGAIKSKKRLYATATPVIREGVEDRESTTSVDSAIAEAEKMKNDPKARVTFYSTDSEIVGGIGGYISQHDAIEAGRLAKPDYQIRNSKISVDNNVKDPVVLPNGTVVERASQEDSKEKPMTVQTYAAVNSTLKAMVADSEEGKNPVHNALAYCGSIEQSEAFRDNFRKVALEESGNMNLNEAKEKVNSQNQEEKSRARMRLLAENADVSAAHSRTDSESVKERKAAFDMFKGRSLTREQSEQGWQSNKRVLANVDIFSEGVNITEIDTVVVSDEDKCSERAMTQAIGRAIRTVPGNSYKNTGHVIVPRAVDESGRELNGSSVAISAYGATRVERGVSISKMQGRGIAPDTSTTFRQYGHSGERLDEVSARDLARGQHQHLADLVASNEISRVHRNLVKKDPSYRTFTPVEQYQVIKSTLQEESQTKRPTALRSGKVLEHLQTKTYPEVRSLRRSNRIVNSAIAAGDVSAFSDEVSSGLIRAGILKKTSDVKADEPTIEEKRKIVEKHATAIAGATATKPSGGPTEEHARVQSKWISNPKEQTKIVSDVLNGHRTGTDKAQPHVENFKNHLTDDSFVKDAYSMLNNDRDKLPIFQTLHKREEISQDIKGIDEEVHQRTAQAARSGENEYTFAEEHLQSSGRINAKAMQKIAKELWE